MLLFYGAKLGQKGFIIKKTACKIETLGFDVEGQPGVSVF